jgi:hypothetical protein
MSTMLYPPQTRKPSPTARPARPAAPVQPRRVRVGDWALVARRCYAVLEPAERELYHQLEGGEQTYRYLTPPRPIEVLEASWEGYRSAGLVHELAQVPPAPAAVGTVKPHPAGAPSPKPPAARIPSDGAGFTRHAREVERDIFARLDAIEKQIRAFWHDYHRDFDQNEPHGILAGHDLD